MHIHAKLICLLLALPAISACVVTGAPTIREDDTECLAGGECRATGNLFIYRGVPASVAELKTDSGCLALALRNDDYTKLKDAQGKTFRVSGMAFEQSVAEGVASYQLEDRWVATGICPSGPILYVTEIARTK